MITDLRTLELLYKYYKLNIYIYKLWSESDLKRNYSTSSEKSTRNITCLPIHDIDQQHVMISGILRRVQDKHLETFNYDP